MSLKPSWPLGASKIQQCVIFGSSLTRRLQGSCHRSDSKRTKGPLSDNVFISRLLLNFFIDIFLYSILFYMCCLLGSQCDRMLAISYYELSFIQGVFLTGLSLNLLSDGRQVTNFKKTLESQTGPPHDQNMSKCLAKWIWLHHLGGASPSKFGGGPV